jgi:2-polyprenyl-3-methyl-5-hydroxy-6-metoxy-1,4-benzoquinol methylase
MDKNYYVEYYKLERENWWFKSRLEIIRSQIMLIAAGRCDLKILNIGTATGATSIMLQEFGSVKSIEYDKDCYEFVKQRLDIDLEIGSILDLQFPNDGYDLVCAFDVIEHVEDDKKAVAEMLRVCKPNGNIMITVPAFNFLWSKHDEVNHHFRRYTWAMLKPLFNHEKVVFHSYFNSILFFPITAVRLLGKLIPFNRKGSGSDFGLVNSPFLNNIFYRLFKSENIFLSSGISLPFGISLMAIARKN